MPVTYDMILEAEAKIKRGLEPPVYKTEEEALQKLGSPENFPPHYILLLAELDKWRADSLYSKAPASQ